jgi:hypothetical protein
MRIREDKITAKKNQQYDNVEILCDNRYINKYSLTAKVDEMIFCVRTVHTT